MKTIEIKLYKFNELSEEAKQNAIENFRNKGSVYTDYIYDEAYETVKEFHKVFGTNLGRHSWLDAGINFDDNILDLTGLRLRTWIINNFYSDLFRRKYLGWSKAEIGKSCNPRKHRMKKFSTDYKGALSCSYWSNTQKEKTCVLTGVCYDMDLLDPIYNFIAWNNPKNDVVQDIESLIDECFESLRTSIEKEVEYRNSNEAIAENLEDNDYDFTENGELY